MRGGHKGIHFGFELLFVLGTLCLPLILSFIPDKGQTSPTQVYLFFPFLFPLALPSFAVVLSTRWNPIWLGGKKKTPKPNLLNSDASFQLNGPFLFCCCFWWNSYGGVRGRRRRTWTHLEHGQDIFTFVESWWNLAVMNPKWVSWCFPSKWDHFVKSKSERGPCARGGGVNGEEPSALWEATWCNSPTTLPHLCWKILNSQRNRILSH